MRIKISGDSRIHILAMHADLNTKIIIIEMKRKIGKIKPALIHTHRKRTKGRWVRGCFNILVLRGSSIFDRTLTGR